MKLSNSAFSESSGTLRTTSLSCLIKYASFDHKSGKHLMLSALILSYLQIISQSLYLTFQYIPNDQSGLSTTAHLIERIFHFDDIFSYGHDDGILLLACCAILIYFIVLLVSFFMVIYAAMKSKKPNNVAAKVFPILLRMHILVLYWPIHNLARRLQLESRDNNLGRIHLNLGSDLIQASSIFISTVDIGIAVIPSFVLFHILPSPNPLSSRDYYIDQTSFLQKLIISFMSCTISTLSETPGVILTVDLLFSLIRQAWFIYAFPRYRIVTFKLEMYMMNITTMLPALTLIIFIINRAIEVPLTTATVIMTFIVLCILIIISIQFTFPKILRKVLFKPIKSLGPYRALYKLVFLNYLVSKVNDPNLKKLSFDPIFFYISIANKCTTQLFEGCNSLQNQTNLNIKSDRKQLKRNFLEFLVSQFPKHAEFKLMLAVIYSKKLGLYTLAIKLLEKMKYGIGSFHVKASSELLHLQIQEHIWRKEQSAETKLNLSEFIEIKNEQESLQTEIKKQLGLHTKFWQEYNHNNTDLFELQKLSQMINKQKITLRKQWARIENTQSKNLAHLCLLYGKYQILLNHSLEKGLKYLQKHRLLYRPFDQTLPLSSSNFFDNSNFSVTITTRPESMGSIINCSESIQKALGYQKNLLVGSSVGVLMSPYISERHNNFISEYVKTGQRSFMGQTQSVFVKDASGSLRKVSLFANISPSLDQGVNLIGLFRMVEDPLEYILLTPDGEIDSYTSEIGSKLRLQRRNAHIENICRDFEEILDSQKVKIDIDSYENFEKGIQLQGLNEEKEPIYLPSKEDYLLTSSRQLLSIRKTSACTPSFSERSPLQALETKVKEQREEKKEISDCQHISKKLKLAFNTYSLIPDKSTQIFSYDCAIDTIQFRNNYLRVLAVEMIDETKAKEKGSIRNMDSFDKKQEAAKDLVNKLMSSSVSTGSASSGRKSTRLEDALNIKYYPKQIFTFIFAMMILIFASLSIEGLFHANTEAAMNKIKALTTTMDLANSRADAFSMLARNTRAAYYIREKYMAPGLAVTNSTNASLFNNLGMYLSKLSSSNSKLQQAIQDVDDSFRESFTASNIRMYDVNPNLTLGSYRNFTTFMAINVLIEKISSMRKTYYTTFPTYEFHTIFQNSVNDLLESTVRTVDIIFNEIESSSEEIESTLKAYQISSMCLIAFRLFLSCWFFYWAYTSEIALGQKFLTIIPEQVELIQQKLHHFGRSLEREDLDQLDHLDDSDNRISLAKVAKVRVNKNIKSHGLVRQYWKRILAYLTLLAVLIGQVNFAFTFVKNEFSSLNHKIESLAKIETMQYEIAILSFTIAQIVCNDFTTTIRNRNPEVELQADLDRLQTTIEALMVAFTEEDGTINPIVTPFFFGDICKLVTTSALNTTCQSITKGAKQFGLFSLLSRHHTIISTLYRNFQLSNKTFPQLQSLVLWSVQNQVPSLNVIKDLIATIMSRLSKNLNQEWGSMYTDIRLVVSLNTCLSVIFWLVVFRFVHWYFFNFYNRLKGMLKIVPFDIIVSNATLKGVLIISSRKALSKIKNHI